MLVERDDNDVAKIKVTRNGEIGEFDFAEGTKIAADALGGGGVDGECAAAVIEFEFAGGAADLFGMVIDGIWRNGEFSAGLVSEINFGTADIMEKWIEVLAVFEVARVFWNVLEAKFVEGGVLRERSAFERKKILAIE